MAMRRIIRITLIGILSVLICITALTGCSKKSVKKEGSIELYYTDKSQTRLTSTSYVPKKTDTVDVVKEVLEQMNKTSKELNMVTAKPESVEIVSVELENSMVTIDFSVAYLEMNRVTELLCRSAVVLTLTQIEGVEYVTFTVGGQPLVNSNNVAIGSMKATDFVDNGESNINSYQKVSVELYYADASGEALTSVNYEGVCEQNASVEKLIIDKLIEGPKEKGYLRTLPENVKLLSVLTKDGICYVNFDASFLTGNVDVSPELEIYSIVNSLSELSYINKVQISVNGETNKKLRDEISLEYPFTRNLDVVKQ